MTTSTTGATLVQTAELLAAHLADHQLPQPAMLGVTLMWGCPQARVQLHPRTGGRNSQPSCWGAETLGTLTLQAWRVPAGERVQLSVVSTLTGPARRGRTVNNYDDYATRPPTLTGDLAPGEKRTVHVGELHAWATTTPVTVRRCHDHLNPDRGGIAGCTHAL